MPQVLAAELSPIEESNPRATRRGCLRRCLLCCVAVLFFLLVGVGGIGLPYTYWHRLGDGQVFEGPDRVVLFVEVERGMLRPGLFPATYPYNFAAAFLRIDVFPDGRVERSTLRFDGDLHVTFNTNLFSVVRLADGFYLVTMFEETMRPAYRLALDRIEELAPEDASQAVGQDVLQVGKLHFELSNVDAISLRRGWRRLNHVHGRSNLARGSDPVNSTRQGMRLRHVDGGVREDSPESIVAESLSPTEHWTQTVINVDTRRWKSYKNPTDRAYLRAMYAASPAP
jgi:hypothetical protein